MRYRNVFNDFMLWVAPPERTLALCFVLWRVYVDYIN